MPDYGSPPLCPKCRGAVEFLVFEPLSGSGQVHCDMCMWTGYHAPRPRLPDCCRKMIEDEFRDKYTPWQPSRKHWTMMALAWFVLAAVVFDIGGRHGWW